MQELLKNLKNKYPEYWHDSNAITQIRSKTLEFLFVAYCVMGMMLAALHFSYHRNFLFWRVLFFTAVSWGGYQMLRRGVAIQKVGHYALICLSIIIVSTTFVYKQGHYLVTLQFIFVVVSSAFYILGATWGLFYSIMNVMVVGAVLVLTHLLNVDIRTQVYTVDPYSLTFTLLYNYAMLLYVHFYFFKESEFAAAKEATLLHELKISATQARELAEYKTNFLVTMSHEIRTPLHAIIGGMDLIIAEKPRADQEKNLESVRFSADVLSAIVNDIMHLNELDENEIQLDHKAFEPAALVSEICHSLKPAAKKKDLDLSLAIAPELAGIWVTGDPVRLAQIVMNLLSNAIQYTEYGSVAVTMHLESNYSNSVKIAFDVSDSGIGIPAEVFPYVFQPFKMVESGMHKQYHGTGLGLSLAHRLVALHGGQLAFRSQEGIGTSFFFDITYSLAVAPTRTELPKVPLAPLPMRVLVAEDNKMNAILLKNFLGKWEVEFDLAENGLAAVEYALTNRYQVILMDINMPLMDGIEATRRIRAFEDREKAKVPIFALTATSRESLESGGMLALFDDWISKPFHPKVLHAKLSELLTGGA